MKIIIGFSSPKKFKIGAELIKWWCSKPYSHTYIRFNSTRISETVYHAAHGMVHFRSFANFLQENDAICEYQLEVTEEQRLKILTYCIDLAGEKYSYAELVKIFVSDLYYYLFNKKLSFLDHTGYICSELIGKILIGFFSFKFNKPVFLLKPNDIEESLKKWPR